MVLDPALEARIEEILRADDAALAGPRPRGDPDSNRKQAVIPEGATVLDPVGTAPGLVVPPREGAGPTVVVLPGPPRELQPMWEMARATEAFRAAIAGAHAPTAAGSLRLFGIPESEIANTLRAAEAEGLELGRLEITTCLRRGEIEVATRYEPAGRRRLRRAGRVHRRAATRSTLFSADGSTVDEQVAALLRRPHGRRRRVLHGRPDGGAAHRPGRAPRPISRAGWWCTPTRPRSRWQASTRS